MKTSQECSYIQFVESRKNWKELYDGRDVNSIHTQILWLISDAVLWNTLNEVRNLATRNEQGNFELNGLLCNFIDRSFVYRQMIVIRRLCSKSKTNSKSHSLYFLIKDMKANSSFLTRSNFIQAKGLHEKPEKLRKEYESHLATLIEKNDFSESYSEPRLEKYNRENKRLDKLMRIAPGKGCSNDNIPESVFEHLLQRLSDTTKNICDQTDQYIAHADIFENRRGLANPEKLFLTIDDLEKAYKAICEVAGFISRHILEGGNWNYLPWHSFGHFRYLDRPLVQADKLSDFSDQWEEFNKRVEDWSSWDIEELEKDLTKDS